MGSNPIPTFYSNIGDDDLMKCKRLPVNYLDKIKTNNKAQYKISKQLPEQLEEFRRRFLWNNPYIELGYTDDGIVLVISKNSVEWDHHYHSLLSKRLNLILHSVEKVETFEPMNYKLSVYYLYIPAFYNKKDNELFSVKFKDVVL